MPTVLRVRGFRFFFCSEEGGEPVHNHVEKAGAVAKFWLNPVRLANKDGFNKQDIGAIVQILEKHGRQLIRAWHETD